MHIAITGATGFVGRRLCELARARGHEVIALSRTAGDRRWDPMAGPAPLQDADAVVHLAGESVAEGRWTRRKMARIRDSRVAGTRNLVAGLRASRARVLVSASAVGYYGDRGEEELTEDSAPGGDFLAGVCRDWEAEAMKSGIRTVCVRIGMVLGPQGGALPRMNVPVRLGTGLQWTSWIHRDDLANLFLYAIDHESLSGPMLGTAPHPVTHGAFMRTLGYRTTLPVPAWTLRLALGKLASLLLSSQKCRPRRTIESGFRFAFPDLECALRHIHSIDKNA